MILHPEDGTALVDRFDSPVSVGDRVVLAKKNSRRYGGAELTEGVIKKITPLVIHPRNFGQTWYSTGPYSEVPVVREDQLHRSYQTEYYLGFDPTAPGKNWSRAYVAAVEVEGMSRLHTVPFGGSMIRVS
jgi:hypothetical protein